MRENDAVTALSDAELRRRLSSLVSESRRVEADLVAHVAEFDGCRLYAAEASPSMFADCADVLHLSEQQAYLRIAVARASRKHPMLLVMLRDGRLHLSGIARLAPHLTTGNRDPMPGRRFERWPSDALESCDCQRARPELSCHERQRPIGPTPRARPSPTPA